MKTMTLTCIECDHEVYATLDEDELCDYPDDCPNCNEPFEAVEDGGDNYREDFHSDV